MTTTINWYGPEAHVVTSRSTESDVANSKTVADFKMVMLFVSVWKTKYILSLMSIEYLIESCTIHFHFVTL